MDISIFKRIYFKQDLLSIEEVFKPYSYFKLGIDSFENKPFGNYTEKVLNNVTYNFVYGDEFDVTYDALTMTEMVGTSNKKLQGLDIEVDYQEIEQVCTVEELENEFSIFLNKHEEEYLKVLNQNLLTIQTNVRVNDFMQFQFSALAESDNNLDELENLIELNAFQKMLVGQYRLSYNNLFHAIKKSYIDVCPSLISEIETIFGNIGQKDSDTSPKSFGNGLILCDDIIMSSQRASRLCKSFIKHSFVKKGTRSETLQNLFKRDVSGKVKTQVEWIGTIPQLKHLIKSLISNEIIQESSYQKKWFDTANCFYKKGLNVDNETFSKNTDPIQLTSKEQLNRIVENLKAQLPKR